MTIFFLLSKGIIVTGDFNVHFHKETREARLLCQLFASFGLVKTNTESTRNGACLDNIFTNLSNYMYSISIMNPSLSDHLALSFEYRADNRNLQDIKFERVIRPITRRGLFNFYNA